MNGADRRRPFGGIHSEKAPGGIATGGDAGGGEAGDRADSPEEARLLYPDLVWREDLPGPRAGDHVFRIARSRSVRRLGSGILEPREWAIEPRDGISRLFWRGKRLLIGRPIPSTREVHERLSKVKALAVLSSDALSSVAYGPEAVMRALVLAGAGFLSLTLPISLAIALLLAIVATSYRQTVRAYPSGGGSYIVAHENLGVLPG